MASEPTAEVKKPEAKKTITLKKATLQAIIAAAIVVLIVAVAAPIFLKQECPTPDPCPECKPQDIKIIELIPVDLTFEELFADRDEADNNRVTLIGFLDRELLDSGLSGGKYKEALMDDHGNKIGLTSLTSKQLLLFPETGTSESLYAVEGTLRRVYQGLDLEVLTVELTERPTEQVERIVS